MTTAIEPSLMLAAADVELMASGRPPTISVVGYTGGMMRVPPFGDLVIDLAGLQLSGDPIPILADHDSSLRGIIGHGVARVNACRLLVQGTLIPGSEATQRIIELNKSGFRFQASVGVAPGIIERVRAGETLHINNRTIQSPQTAFSLVRTGELREISLVALGADASTSVSIAASRNKGFGMTTDNITPTADEIRAEALAETERIAAIRKACGSRFTEIEATAIRDGWDGQRTELEVLRASRPVVQAGTVDDDAFKAKTAEFKADTARVTEEIDAGGDVDPARGKAVLAVFDWSQKAAEIWRGSNTTARRQILDSICLNRQVSDVTLVTAKRKPFDFFVERLDLKKNRGDTI